MAAAHLSNVQILRFFAALFVVFAHVGAAIGEYTTPGESAFLMVHPLDWGLGVDVFFIISGFIMYFLMRERFREPGVSVAFLKRRFLRIVPLYWFCTTLTLASILAAGSVVNNNGFDPAHIVASYLFFPWPRSNGEVFPILSLGWTLNYEALFYLLFGVALCFSRRMGLAVLLGTFVLLVVTAQFVPESWLALRFWGNTIIGEFPIGMALAAAFSRGLRFPPSISVAFVLVGFVVAMAFYQSGSYEFLSRLITGGIPASLIACGIIFARNGSASLLCRWASAGGDASYALYLTHPFVSKIIAIIGSKIGLPPVLTFGVAVVTCVAISLVVYHAFERPVGAFLNRRLLPQPV